MTLGTLLAVAAMVLTDPTGDAAGDGTLTAPSAPIYANASIFDLQEVEVEGDDTGATLRITLGSLENASSLPEGFSGVIVDVYVDAEPGGATITLPGPGMRMPPGRGWQFGVRISGDGAYAVRYAELTDGGNALDPGEPASVGNAGAAQAGAEPAAEPEAALDDLGRVPLAIARDGSTLSVRIPWPVGEHPEVYAMSGVYDPFTPTGWRPLAAAPSPWAFSGVDQAVPVVDVLAPDADAQERALRSAVLPRMRTRSALASPWLLVMAAGLALAALGLWLRRKVAPDTAVGAPEQPPEVVEQGPAPEADEASAAPPSASVALALRSDVPPEGASSGVADASAPEPAVASAAPDTGPPERDAPSRDPFAAFGAGDEHEDEPETEISDGFAKPARPRAEPGSDPVDVETNEAESAEPQDAAETGVVEDESSSTDGPADAEGHRR